MLDLKSNQWEQINLKGSPSPRSGHRMVSSGCFRWSVAYLVDWDSTVFPTEVTVSLTFSYCIIVYSTVLNMETL